MAGGSSKKGANYLAPKVDGVLGSPGYGLHQARSVWELYHKVLAVPNHLAQRSPASLPLRPPPQLPLHRHTIELRGHGALGFQLTQAVIPG